MDVFPIEGGEEEGGVARAKGLKRKKIARKRVKKLNKRGGPGRSATAAVAVAMAAVTNRQRAEYCFSEELFFRVRTHARTHARHVTESKCLRYV